MFDRDWDRLLKIKTTGRDDSHSDQYNYPYEPTPYRVLERLANEGYITKRHTVLDYGCGKGRVEFFLSWQIRCRTIGVEFDERIQKAALKNRASAVSGSKTEFIKGRAEDFTVPDEVDCCYFFHPFSVEILRQVTEKIKESRNRKQREILLFFYYPSDEYISYLMTDEDLLFIDEIDCRDLFLGNDKRECILIFSIG